MPPPQSARVKQSKLKEHRRWSSWFIFWGIALGCWIWYHSAKIPAWLHQGSLYGQIVHRQRLFLEETGDFRQGMAITDTIEEMDHGLRSEDGQALEQGDSNRYSLEDQEEREEWNFPEEDQLKNSRTCATVEEMGAMATARSTRLVDLNLRGMIEEYFAEHGARRVRALAGEDFCKRNFIFGRAKEDGFGNEMYKILTAAGLSLMLNRSLIVGEDSSQNPGYLGLNERTHHPFGDYISFSRETFTMRELKHLWVIHECATRYKRPLKLRMDLIQRPSGTNSLCGDWSKWSQPIIWFYGAQDAVALQIFLKNINFKMKTAATKILGDSFAPSTRGNLYGELMHAFVSPKPDIVDAVRWALGGGRDPDLALHLRMLHSRSRRAVETACICLKRMINQLNLDRLPRIAIVTDTPAVVDYMRTNLEAFAEVIHFDYRLYLASSPNVSDVMKENYFQPPKKRVDDWGPLPRWVALVDFFLASRAKYGVVSGGSKRVATTYAQLLASLAAANTLVPGDEHGKKEEDFMFYSSFHPALVTRGLSSQRGWGHAWRTFSGRLSCANQTTQCAITPLLPHAWWDGPWQLPTSRDARIMRSYGIEFNSSGNVVEEKLAKFCRSRKRPATSITKLELPPCKKLNFKREF
ncbi:uncharacterized protein LOC9661735 [Selaginella moellendorffii]|uniref:uncharacterized protein LOC9661735 n=1 Tax=Selaginella moellendorffii TaxID=88036 RepID=UPI000D1C26D2|nr:uncharacterized protein LOC9661735 [Selaginella moellendorffii]|eukprot:XP_024521815.1 uncharacterized protein LOC9661735 [Selaginella moellendorffii]